jgi:hypothetical protein
MKLKKTKKTEKKKTAKKTKDIKAAEIICVIDRSGSMDSTKADAIGGFNAFLEKQKKLSKKTLISAMFFNAPVEKKLLYDGVKITEVEPLNEQTYVPDGMTALFDAIGTTVGLVLERHGKMKKAPRTLLMILTDGGENSSHEYTSQQIKDKLTELQDKTGWKVAYIGASADAFTQNIMQNISTTLNVKGFNGYSGYSGLRTVNAAYNYAATMSCDFVANDNDGNKGTK